MINPVPSYVGVWLLVPELCLYESGDPPTAGVCKIVRRDATVEIAIDWTSPDGAKHNLASGGPVDGSLLEIDIAGLTHASFTHIDDATLDSAAYNDIIRVTYARRRVSADGALMVTMQELFGGAVRNFQVYRRALL